MGFSKIDLLLNAQALSEHCGCALQATEMTALDWAKILFWLASSARGWVELLPGMRPAMELLNFVAPDPDALVGMQTTDPNLVIPSFDTRLRCLVLLGRPPVDLRDTRPVAGGTGGRREMLSAESKILLASDGNFYQWDATYERLRGNVSDFSGGRKEILHQNALSSRFVELRTEGMLGYELGRIGTKQVSQAILDLLRNCLKPERGIVYPQKAYEFFAALRRLLDCLCLV
jgi:hypothetical protein